MLDVHKIWTILTELKDIYGQLFLKYTFPEGKRKLVSGGGKYFLQEIGV